MAFATTSPADNRARIVQTFATTATGSTKALKLKGCNVDQRNFFDISVQFTGTGTVTLQRKRPGESAWRDIEAYTTDTEKIGEMHGNWDVRLTCNPHGGSGDIDCELAQS